MVGPNMFDLTVNAFEELISEVFSGTNEEQKTKLKEKLNHFNKMINTKGKRK